MGCDIHAAVEFRVNADSTWQAVKFVDRYDGEPWREDKSGFTFECDFNRDYDLFAILGNVRNGSGFAGVVTGDGFDPMSDNRGVPEDVSSDALEVLSDDHSATWVTLREILEYDWDRSTGHTGVVSAVEFADWQVMKTWIPAPASYCGGISGPSIVMVSEAQMRSMVASTLRTGTPTAIHPRSDEAKKTLKESMPNIYCQVRWVESYAVAGKQLWTLALPKMLNLGRSHGYDNVRLVMDFDS